MKKILLFLVICNISYLFSYENGLRFIENKSQWPKKVLFSAELSNGNLFIENKGLTWQLWSEADLKIAHDLSAHNTDSLTRSTSAKTMHGHVFCVEFVNAIFANYKTYNKQKEYYNYFIGNDPITWGSGANAFGAVLFKDIYKNVDLKIYTATNDFKYDLILKSGANVNDLKLKYNYTNGLKIANNKLIIQTSIGQITESIPVAFQIINGKKIIIACYYKLIDKNEISFELGKNYDPTYDLVIDPAVVVSTFSGSSSVSYGLGITTDASNNIYMSAMNITKKYPTTFGVVQTTFGGGVFDCVISKFNSAGSAKIFSTYIGGNREEVIINCMIQKNELAVFGWTSSDTFPIIKSGFKTNIVGSKDYFLVKLDTSGKNNLASTYLGGHNAEANSSTHVNDYYGNFAGEMIMDQNRECYIIGTSYSSDYPTTPGAVKPFSDSLSAGDVVVTKINASLSQLLWSTYLHGEGSSDDGVAIELSRTGNLYCLVNTDGKKYPATNGVVFPVKGLSQDMAITKLDGATGQLLASSFIAFNSKESGDCMALDQFENVYVVGNSYSALTVTATAGAFNVSGGNVLFCKLDKNLTSLNSVSKFGYTTPQATRIEIDALNVDSCGYVYFGGFAYPGLPVTSNAFKANPDPKGDMYIGVLNTNFSSLKFGSYYGADDDYDHDDGGWNYFDKRGYFYHANCIGKGFPTSPGCYAPFIQTDSLMSNNIYYRNSDAFVKIDLQTFVNASSTLGGLIKSCDPVTVNFVASTNLGTVAIIPGDGSPISYTNSLTHSYTTYGNYVAYVIAGTDSTTCNKTDSIKTIIRYGPPPTDALSDQTASCRGVTDLLDALNLGSDYYWNTGQTTQIISPQQAGEYYVKISNEFCDVIDSSYVYLLDADYPMILPNIITPNNDGVNDVWDFSKYAISFLDFTVYNRWGVIVYKTADGNSKWGGVNINGHELSEGTYFWSINYKTECKPNLQVQQKGYIQIVR